MVGPAAELALPDARDADNGLLHDTRRHAAHRGVEPVPDPHAVSAAAREPALAQLSAPARRRESLARDALLVRRGTARPGSATDRAVRLTARRARRAARARCRGARLHGGT